MPDTPKVVILIILLYFFSLLILKQKNTWHKISGKGYSNLCPKCKANPLERVKKQKKDYLVNYLTFQIFNFKRYKCIKCLKSFMRWEKRFR